MPIDNFEPQPAAAVAPGVAGSTLIRNAGVRSPKIVSPSNTRHKIAWKLRRSCATPDNLCAVVIEPSEFDLHHEPQVRPKIVRYADEPIEMPEFDLRLRRYREMPPAPR
jgi:hypothetical protein